MVELLGLIFGGVARLVPEVLSFFDRRNQREHELRLLDKQIEADRLRASMEMQKIELQGEIEQSLTELKAMMAASVAASQPVRIERTGNRLADVLIALFEALSASVRPVITYWYVLIGYGTYKGALLYLALSQGIGFAQAVTGLWTEFDSATVASIISFWFLDRALRRMKG